MENEEYDKDANEDDAAYHAFVAWLSDLTVAELRAAKGDRGRQRLALARYWRRGYRANLTPAELIDFLGVDSPSILDRAGYSGPEGDAAMRVSDGLRYDEIQRTDLAGAG